MIKAAQAPITLGELIGKLVAELPGSPLARVEGMLTELVCCRILVTSLHPPMDVTDPLGHVIDRLAGIETGAAPLFMVRELRAISGQLSRHDQAPSPGACRALRASVLVRLTPHRFGNPSWQAWHARFLDRCGSGAVIPIRQVVDVDTGLGYPAGYRGSVMTQSAPTLLARDRTLLRLAQQAALDGSDEVVLDEHTLSELAAESTDTRPPHGPAHTELRFRLHAPTMDALDRGEFTFACADREPRPDDGARRDRPIHDHDEAPDAARDRVPTHDRAGALRLRAGGDTDRIWTAAGFGQLNRRYWIDSAEPEPRPAAG